MLQNKTVIKASSIAQSSAAIAKGNLFSVLAT